MASSKSQVKELLGAQSVAGNLIVGQREKRVLVGKTDENGLFELTPEGKELVDAKLRPGKTTKTEKPKQGKVAKSMTRSSGIIDELETAEATEIADAE